MTIKGEQKSFRLGDYQILIHPISEKKLNIEAVDIKLKIQFSQQQLTLQQIGTSTLLLALSGTRKQISIVPSHKKQGELEILQLKVIIQSPFLKTIEQTIFIKKFRNMEQIEIMDRRMKSLQNKLKAIKTQNADQGSTYYAFQPQQKTFNGATYETLCSLRLKKGKYLITFSFQLKATNQWLYLYLNQGQSIITNAGFYVPSQTQFMPFSVRIVKNIGEDQKEVAFTTNSASSYPAILRNRIITAQRLAD